MLIHLFNLLISPVAHNLTSPRAILQIYLLAFGGFSLSDTDPTVLGCWMLSVSAPSQDSFSAKSLIPAYSDKIWLEL